MDFTVYIRPLQIEDADVSYNWRNNPKIWRLTGSQPDRYITPEMERAWLQNVLNRNTEKRFAICLKDSNIYIGNVFLTDIKDGSALIHIFIGDVAYWGKRRALEAMVLLIQHGFEELHLDEICAVIDKNNVFTTAMAKMINSIPLGHFIDGRTQKEMTKWKFTRQMFEQDFHLKALQNNFKLSKEDRTI